MMHPKWVHIVESACTPSLSRKIATARPGGVNASPAARFSGRTALNFFDGLASTADKVSAHLAKMKAPAGKEAQFKELSETWAAFKKTRETELVPAVLAGKDDDAKKLVNGVQKERYTKCQQILGDLGG